MNIRNLPSRSGRRKKSRPCHTCNRKVAAVELLEARQLLSADLTGAFTGVVPSAFAVAKTNPLTVRVTNVGDATAIGNMTVTLYASAGSTPDGSQVALTGPVTRRVNLKMGKSINIPFRATAPASLATGNYYVLADIVPSSAIGDVDVSDKFAPTPSTITITQPFVDLEGSLSTKAAGTFTVGSRPPKLISATVSVLNAGNVPARGLMQIDLYASSGQTISSTDTLLASKSFGRVAIVNGKSQRFVITVVPGKTVPSGTFYLVGRINPSDAIAESNTNNNIAPSSGTIVVVNPAIPPGPVLGGPLTVSTTAATVGISEEEQFSIPVGHAGPSTRVEVDEFDASGNNLGEFAPLADDGNVSNGDLTAGDGIFGGVNVVGFTAPGTRYFAAVVSDPNLSTPIHSATISIIGSAPLTQSQFDPAEADSASLNQAANTVLAGGGSIQAAIAAVEGALGSDANVVPGSIQMTATGVSWQDSAGIEHLFDTDMLNTDVGTPPASPFALLTPSQAALLPSDVTPASTAHSGSPSLVLEPFPSQWLQRAASPTIASKLTAAGYNVTFHDNGTNGAVTLNDFKGLGQYDTIAIETHGDVLNGNVVLATGVQTSDALDAQFQADLHSVPARLVAVGVPAGLDSSSHLTGAVSDYAITPAWISYYSGTMNGTVVYVDACDSLGNQTMANAFTNLGAGAYIGYDGPVTFGFAHQQGIATFTTLLNDSNNTVGDIPGINMFHDWTNHGTLFTELGPLSTTLPAGLLLSNYDVYVHYSWPQNVRDLDTNTSFLGSSAGYNLSGSAYLNWGGDNTGSGGSETTTVNIDQAFIDGAWSGSTVVGAGADWYTPAGGSGPAYIVIGLQNKTTGTIVRIVRETVQPGQETSGAMDTQYNADISLAGDPSNPVIVFNVVAAR